MATLNVDITKLDKIKPAPTEGEITLLKYLHNKLGDSFEVFFQPHFNGENPDIVVLKKNGGVLIFEVKDWHLNHYGFDTQNGNWSVFSNGSNRIILSPYEQVNGYRNSFYNLYIEDLAEKSVENTKHYSLVTTFVYFYKATQREVINLVGANDYKKLNKYDKTLCRDDLDKQFSQFLNENKYFRDGKSIYFGESLYKAFGILLSPAWHSSDEGKEIHKLDDYTKEEYCKYQPGTVSYIDGVAGSGKTLILANKAVEAARKSCVNDKKDKNISPKILILTFNITLRNYIRDRISDIKEEFAWNNFLIIHYHAFIKTYCRNSGIKLSKNEDEDEDIHIGDKNEELIKNRYSVILVDETQDFDINWIKTIFKLLTENGTITFFGDKSQDIYDRKFTVSTIYNLTRKYPKLEYIKTAKIKKSKRVTNNIGALVSRFFNKYLKNNENTEIPVFGKSLFLEHEQTLRSYKCDEINDINAKKIADLIIEFQNEYDIHNEDICVVSSRIEALQIVDKMIRCKRIGTTTNFESSEKNKFLKNKHNDNTKAFKESVDKIRRSKKFNFQMGNGKLKLCTTHSFKGWEIHTLFLILGLKENDELIEETKELIYTALTRTIANLIVINTKGNEYETFFSYNFTEMEL